MSGATDDYHQGERLGPGIYVSDDEMHIDVAEWIVACGGNPGDPTDLAIAQRVPREIAAQQGITVLEL